MSLDKMTLILDLKVLVEAFLNINTLGITDQMKGKMAQAKGI